MTFAYQQCLLALSNTLQEHEQILTALASRAMINVTTSEVVISLQASQLVTLSVVMGILASPDTKHFHPIFNTYCITCEHCIIYKYTYIYIRTYLHTYTCIRTYIHTHIHTYIHIYIQIICLYHIHM